MGASMTISTYTTPANIRSVLGVDDDELPDATVLLAVYEDALTLALTTVYQQDPSQDVEALYTTASVGTTKQEKLFCAALRQFVTYYVASRLCSSLPLFTTQAVGDSKDSMERFATNPYRDTITSVKTNLNESRGNLVTLMGALLASSTPVVVSRPYFSVVAPDRDMVTDTQ